MVSELDFSLCHFDRLTFSSPYVLSNRHPELIDCLKKINTAKKNEFEIDETVMGHDGDSIVDRARLIANDFQDLTELYEIFEHSTLDKLTEAFLICSKLPNLKKINYISDLVDL